MQIKIESEEEKDILKVLAKKQDPESKRMARFLKMPDLSRTPGSPLRELAERIINLQDFKDFDIKYSGAGRPAYHPRIILKILLIGVLDRVRSSRRLAKNARENLVYIYLSEKLSPDFRTINDFRKNNPDLVKYAFKHTITIAKNEGLLDLSILSTDGTKIKANASSKLTKDEKG